MTYGLIAFLVGIVASRYLSERGYSTLSDAEKTRLMDGFSQHRKYSLIPLVLYVLLYLGAVRLFPEHHRDLTHILLGGTVVYMTSTSIWMKRRLKALEIPPSYVKTFLWARGISFVAVLVMFGSFAWGM